MVNDCEKRKLGSLVHWCNGIAVNLYTPLEVHSVIRFFVVSGEKVAEITQMLKEMYGECCCCDESTVKRWMKQFHEGRTCLGMKRIAGGHQTA